MTSKNQNHNEKKKNQKRLTRKSVYMNSYNYMKKKTNKLPLQKKGVYD